jgi:phospholipid/cholesterol/gamma-HCH transport system substrate-binding protein
MKRLTGVLVVVALMTSACALIRDATGAQTYRARFSRAIQVFPGGDVRVLGVDVGLIQDVQNVPGAVEVTFTVDDPEVKLPQDVQAVIVPASLLGERYIQLFPAYQGGPALEPDATIPIERTGVPSEPDELLRSLQDYLGALDPQTVTSFVENAAAILDGTGQTLNSLIHHAAEVLSTLSAKRDDLAQIIVEFDRLSLALNTRKAKLSRLIHTYNEVVGTVTTNRTALEGSIDGLNEMAVQLGSLLIDHRKPLHQDIRVLTRTGRTVNKNVDTLARTGHWAQRLFRAAENAVDFPRQWLRLNNQGQALEQLIVERLMQRLTALCADLGLPICATPRYWETEAPSLFCFEESCVPEPRKEEGQSTDGTGGSGGAGGGPAEELADAIEQVPTLLDQLLDKAQDIACQNAKDPQACKRRKRILLHCLNSNNARRCLEDKAVLLDCLKSADVQGCLERKTDEETRELVDGLLEDTLGDALDDITGQLPGGVSDIGDLLP